MVREPAARERLATAMMGANGKKVLAAPVTAVFCADLGEFTYRFVTPSLLAALLYGDSRVRYFFVVSFYRSGADRFYFTSPNPNLLVTLRIFVRA